MDIASIANTVLSTVFLHLSAPIRREANEYQLSQSEGNVT